MNVLVAMDSFKGSLSAFEATEAIQSGIRQVSNQYIIHTIPLADGGEGTFDVLMSASGKKTVRIEVLDALFRPITVEYGVLNNDTVIIEMACVAGLEQLTEKDKNPLNTTTYGVGEMILDALDKGYRSFIIGLGGSATNDGGIGMLDALGYRFYNKDKNRLKPVGKSLIDIASIHVSHANLLLRNTTFIAAVDVKNPFYGKDGAAYVYAKQKGASESAIKTLDAGLINLARHIKEIFNHDINKVKGSGAAGGMGGAMYSFLGASLQNGTSIVFDNVSLEEEIKWADIVVTGEGKIDYQTFFGKAPYGVISLANKYNKRLVILTGINELDISVKQAYKITAIHSIMETIKDLDKAMNPVIAKAILTSISIQVFSNYFFPKNSLKNKLNNV